MKKSLSNNMIWNSVGTIFYFGCQWLLTVFVVHFDNGYSDAGVLSLAMAVSAPLLVVSTLNLRTFQVSELEGCFSDGDFWAHRILTSIISFILCVCVVKYKGYSKYEGICILVFMSYKITESLTDALHGVAQKAWRLDIAGKSLVLRGLATLIASALGIFFGKNLIITLLIMAILTYFITFFYDYNVCKKQLHFDFSYNRNNILKLTKIGIPLALYFLFFNLMLTYPRFQIEEQYGEKMLGIFSSVATPTVLVTQLALFIFNPLIGVFAECRKDHNKKKIYRLLFAVLGSTILIGALSAIAGSTLGEWVLVFFFGEIIREYTYLLVPIIFTAILTAFVVFFSGMLTVYKDYCVLAAFTSISLLVCLIVAPYLIAENQLIGAVFSIGLALVVEIFFVLARLFFLFHEE